MEKIRAGAEIDQHGIGESGTDRMAIVSVYSFWKSYDYTRGSGRRKNNDGSSDHC